MKKMVKDWLIVLVSLLDDAAVALLVLLILWLLGVSISLPVIVLIVMLFIALAFFMHKLIIPALHREKAVGIEAMVGLQGRVVESLRPAGLIMVKGEYWKAMSVEGNIETDMPVEVVEVEGLALRVKRIT